MAQTRIPSSGLGSDLTLSGTTYFAGNILPTSNNTVNIGSPTQRFGTVYLSANSIDIGGAVISTTEQGSVLVETTTGNIDLNANAVSFLSNVAQGTAGQTGYTGSRGTDGVIGVDGYTGSAGASGPIGYTGSKGSGAVTIGNTTPVGSTSGDLWYRESNDTMYRYMVFDTGSYWIDITGPVHNFGISDAEYTQVQESVAVIGQAAYTAPGTYTWTAPAYVTKVSAVCIGGGGGSPGASTNTSAGAGGGLGWKNNIAVVPGQTYTVVVGAGGTVGTDSYFINTTTVKGGGGGLLSAVGTWTGDGGGNGGAGSGSGAYQNTGGGGAGGYAGNGGSGGATAGSAGTGGAGGGGCSNSMGYGGGGGGVGIFGQGTSGAGGIYAGTADNGGRGGSGGENGGSGYNWGVGGLYGGGGSGGGSGAGGGVARGGAVRIIWGAGRAFPSTLTTDLS